MDNQDGLENGNGKVVHVVDEKESSSLETRVDKPGENVFLVSRRRAQSMQRKGARSALPGGASLSGSEAAPERMIAWQAKT